MNSVHDEQTVRTHGDRFKGMLSGRKAANVEQCDAIVVVGSWISGGYRCNKSLHACDNVFVGGFELAVNVAVDSGIVVRQCTCSGQYDTGAYRGIR